MKGKVNEDLQNERRKCSFNVEELTNYLDNGVENKKYRRALEDKVFSIKGLIDEVPEEYLSHKEKYENSIRKAVIYYTLLRNLEDFNPTDEKKLKLVMRNMITSSVFKDQTPFTLHVGMFVMTIKGLADDKQKEHWLKRAENMEFIGTYAQTELGHGTFIRGLETTATYDPDTEEFVLNSPTLSSYKWWPGGLAHTANYCIVMAQLYSKGQHCGIQPFLVQIRDEETHMPLSGIKVGEIGAKQGFNSANNGFLGFDKLRIPRDRMLMKNAQVLKDGTFKGTPNNKLVYGTMVYVRVSIVLGSANLLSRAVTIAVRYSAVRRQSQPKPDEPEPQILDYVTQQHKLFIAIATSYAFSNVVEWLWWIYLKVNKELENGNLENLPELHALACCLKAVSTTDCTKLVEQCRLACGGHGYMLASNLPQTYALLHASCTYEGENTVLMLQTARYLVKAWQQASEGKTLSPILSYLKKENYGPWNDSIDGIIEAFQKVATGKLKSTVNSLQKYISSGISPEEAWNRTSVQLVQAAEAHCRCVILSVYKTHAEKTTSSLSAPLRRVLLQMLDLYSVYWAIETLGDLLLFTSINEKDIQKLQLKYEALLEEIRPNAVGLVDGFDYRDEILNSALGAYDGQVYERLMAEAMKSPLNAEPVNVTFHKYLKPFMQGKL